MGIYVDGTGVSGNLHWGRMGWLASDTVAPDTFIGSFSAYFLCLVVDITWGSKERDWFIPLRRNCRNTCGRAPVLIPGLEAEF